MGVSVWPALRAIVLASTHFQFYFPPLLPTRSLEAHDAPTDWGRRIVSGRRGNHFVVVVCVSRRLFLVVVGAVVLGPALQKFGLVVA
jgi:hypothetical protein